MREPTIAKCVKVEKLVAGGLSPTEAMKKVGMSAVTWRKYKLHSGGQARVNIIAPSEVKRTYTKKRATPTSKLAVVFGSTKDIAELLREMHA